MERCCDAEAQSKEQAPGLFDAPFAPLVLLVAPKNICAALSAHCAVLRRKKPSLCSSTWRPTRRRGHVVNSVQPPAPCVGEAAACLLLAEEAFVTVALRGIKGNQVILKVGEVSETRGSGFGPCSSTLPN